MATKSLVNEILTLREIPSSEDKDDSVPPVPSAVARQIKNAGPDEREMDSAFLVAKEIAAKQQAQHKLIAEIYEQRLGKTEKGAGRSVVINVNGHGVRDDKQVRHLLETEYAPERKFAEQHRPRKRSDCQDGERPCPWVSCRYHLATDVTVKGSIKLNFPNPKPGDELPEIDFDSMLETCALDVADERAITLEAVGVYANLTRERIRQLEEDVKGKMRERGVQNKLLNEQGLPNPTGQFVVEQGGNGNGNGKALTDNSAKSAAKKSDEIDFELGDNLKGLEL